MYRLNIGNAARNCEQKLIPVEVTSVGRKYFKCIQANKGYVRFEQEFHVDTWRQKTDYCCDYMLYETEQEWLDEKETRQLINEIRQSVDSWKQVTLTLQQPRDIQAIINQPTP